jgi:F-type H+-transporting ATPase subunit b
MRPAKKITAAMTLAAAFIFILALPFVPITQPSVPVTQQLVLITQLFVPAFASEGGAHGGEAHGGSVLAGMFWPSVNFLIIVSVLYYFLKKPLKEFFSQRTALIEKSIAEARQAKALAQKILDEMEEKLRLKDKEVLKIIQTAEELGRKERDRLIEDGRQMSLRIADTVGKNIQSEFKKAMDALREEAVDIAVEMAGKKAAEKITGQQQRKLTEESIRKIGSLN